MVFNVAPDFRGATKHLAAWTEKKVFGDHISSAVIQTRLGPLPPLSSFVEG
jgi:hypothetical protein